mmetsp:Transcript_44000/g.110557  ORF Transcript_44000/g.110557 Transcript_44000/m.110557 type:complete len:208 (+) Transcript_44000:4590-5213(+)
MRDSASCACFQWHDHLHGFQFHVGVATLYRRTVRLQVPDDLPVELRAQLCRIVDRGKHNGTNALQAKAQPKSIFGAEDLSHKVANCDEQRAIRLYADLRQDAVVPDIERIRIVSCPQSTEVVPHALKSDLHLEAIHTSSLTDQPEPAFGHSVSQLLITGACSLHDTENCSIEDDVSVLIVRLHGLGLDDAVQPGGVDVIPHESLCCK